MNASIYKDWGEVSSIYDDILKYSKGCELHNANEAQTRFDIIDKFIRDILQWQPGQITVEEYDDKKLDKKGFIDYVLRYGDTRIVIEAKKLGSTFPNFSRKKRLKLTGSILGAGAINAALLQAEEYAKNKNANIVCVTNGRCWCFYPYKQDTPRDSTYAYLLFPLDSVADAQQLFSYFSLPSVEGDSLESILSETPLPIQRCLINTEREADARLGRNSIADLIAPALDFAFHGESIIDDKDKLEYCFVNTDARTKYDNTLKIFINDRKSPLISPAKRIKKSKEEDELQQVVKNMSSI
jgi:hypothetical protein